MISSKRPLALSIIIISFLTSFSATLNIPSSLSPAHPLNLINTTSTPLLAPPPHSLNLTLSPWPPRPYSVQLYPRLAYPVLGIIIVDPPAGEPPVRVSFLLDLIRDFSNNIEREYPIPGQVPRHARQSVIDLDSYARWTIELDEGHFGYRPSTEWALLALEKLSGQLVKHGPADVNFSIVKARSINYCFGSLTSQALGGPFRNESSADDGGQTTSQKKGSEMMEMEK